MPETDTKRLAELEKQVIDLKLAAINKSIGELETRLSAVADKSALDDHEKRIRDLETTAARVNALIWLVTGGGLLSAVNLYLLLAGR
jgi:hypothetical protein